MQKQQSTVIFVTRGSDPLMQEVRHILSELQMGGQPIGHVSSFTGDVSYEPDCVTVFVYDERTMRTSGRQTPIRRRSSCLCVGHMTSLYDRLEMAKPTWAPNASVFIALWPDADRDSLAQALTGAVRYARKALCILALPSGPSKKQQRAAAYRAKIASRPPRIMNRPSKEYIEELEDRHGIIGS